MGHATSPKVDPVTDESVECKDADAGNRPLGHSGGGEMVGRVPSDPKCRDEHHEADTEADEIFQLSDSVGESVIGGSSDGTDGEKSGKDREEVGRFLEKIAEDGERVGEVSGCAHENDVQKAEKERIEETSLPCACFEGAVHAELVGWRNRG